MSGYSFRLYVAGSTQRSRAAEADLRSLCDARRVTGVLSDHNRAAAALRIADDDPATRARTSG